VFGEKTISGTYYGSVRPDIDFPILADLDMDKKLNLDDLISRTYKFDEDCRTCTSRAEHAPIAPRLGAGIGRSRCSCRHCQRLRCADQRQHLHPRASRATVRAVTLPAYTSGRLLVELLAHVLVTVGGIVTYAPVQLKRLV
jgi:hypothetical protein